MTVIKEKNMDDLDKTEKTVNTDRIKRLAWAELFDAWRVFPRFLVIMYMILVTYLVKWFFEVKTYAKVQCDAAVMEKLLAANVPLDRASEIACRTIDIIGGPTTTHTILVTTICGLSAAIFGMYTSSGRDWARGALPWKFRSIFKDKDEDNEKNEATSEKNDSKD